MTGENRAKAAERHLAKARSALSDAEVMLAAGRTDAASNRAYLLSPSTAATDRVRKMPSYAAHGVRHAWLVDPILLTLEVFRPEGSAWLLVGTFGGDAKVRAEPCDAIEIDLASLWAPG